MQTSAVDFLHSKILFNIGLDDNDIFKLRELVKIAKKLEQKQHSKTWDAALSRYEVRAGNYFRTYDDFDDYFDETYKIKASETTSSKAEISDDEIEIMLFHHSNEYAIGFKDAIKWHKEQLKNKL